MGDAEQVVTSLSRARVSVPRVAVRQPVWFTFLFVPERTHLLYTHRTVEMKVRKLGAAKEVLRGAPFILLAASKETLRGAAVTVIPAALAATCIWYFAIRPPPEKASASLETLSPSARPEESPSIGPSVQPSSTPLPDHLTMLRATATPSTPLGRYEKTMKDAISSRWHAFMDREGELVNVGTLKLDFFIDRSGKVNGLKITENTSNEAFANICLQAIFEAKFPPIPEEVANILPSEGLEIEGMSFSVYAPYDTPAPKKRTRVKVKK